MTLLIFRLHPGETEIQQCCELLFLQKEVSILVERSSTLQATSGSLKHLKEFMRISYSFLPMKESKDFIFHQQLSLESSPTSPLPYLAHGLPVLPDLDMSVIITNNTPETLLEHTLEPTVPLFSNTLCSNLTIQFLFSHPSHCMNNERTSFLAVLCPQALRSRKLHWELFFFPPKPSLWLR